MGLRDGIDEAGAALMKERGVDFSTLMSQAEALEVDGKTVMFVALNRQAAGLIAVADTLKEYSAAAQLAPDNAEMVYWHAVALVNMGRVDESLPLFRRVFAMDKNWVTLTPRLVKSGLLPDDPKLINRIVKEGD